METEGPFTKEDIMNVIPHRDPILLIDRVIEMRRNEFICAEKDITADMPVFQGHYPGNPIFPGVYIIEAMAQAASFLGLKTNEDVPGEKVPLFAGIEKARFKKTVLPGDTLVLEVTKTKERASIWWVEGVAKVDGKVVARAGIQAAFQVIE